MRAQIKTNPFQRPSHTREFKKKLFFAFEGETTEVKYFSGFLKKNNINNYQIIFFSNESSNPKSISDHIMAVIDNKDSIEIQYNSIIDIIVDYCADKEISLSRNKIHSIVDKHASKRMKGLEDAFDVDSIEDLASKVCKAITEISLIPSVLTTELEDIVKQSKSYEADLDIISLIVDRDCKSFTENQYDIVLETCKQKNIKLFVTNPCIEFWFLLHHTDCVGLEEKLKANKVAANGFNFAYNKLKEFDEKYKKNKVNAEWYLANYHIAETNSKLYEKNICNLKENIGTNIDEIKNVLK